MTSRVPNHLDGAGHHAGAFSAHAFFAGQQRAGHAAGHQPVAALQRQQAQRRQVGAVNGAGQLLEGGVGLAAVGRAHIQRHLALELPRQREAVGVALEGQFLVQAAERLLLVDLVFPAVLGTGAGGFQVSQRLRPRTFGLQPRQQRRQLLVVAELASLGQRVDVRAQLGRMRPVRRAAQAGQQHSLLAIAEKGPDRLGRNGHPPGHAQRAGLGPIRKAQRQGLAHQPLPTVTGAGDADGVQRGAALDHQRPGFATHSHFVKVQQRRIDQRRGNPSAGPLIGHGLLQQDQAQGVQVGFEVGRVFRQVVGRLDHLRQVVGGLADPLESFGRDVGRYALGVTGVGELEGAGNC